MLNDLYEVLSVEETMDYMLIGKNKLYSLLQSGKLKGFRVGRKWRIPRKSIQDYINKECYLND